MNSFGNSYCNRNIQSPLTVPVYRSDYACGLAEVAYSIQHVGRCIEAETFMNLIEWSFLRFIYKSMTQIKAFLNVETYSSFLLEQSFNTTSLLVANTNVD